MTVFDDILVELRAAFEGVSPDLARQIPILLNRDLNGKVRLIVDSKLEPDIGAVNALRAIAADLERRLGRHAFPVSKAIIFEPDFPSLFERELKFKLDCEANTWVVDRLITGRDWGVVSARQTTPPRVTFFAIKGGVGRSTALAATAYSLAEQGMRVLILDLDLASPGLSSSLLPLERRPLYGIVDWLVEDLVDNADEIATDICGQSLFSRNGEIFVVPAYGREPGEYINKLGRAWMPKLRSDGSQEVWTQRLARLLLELEARWMPDIVLLDARAGIDDVAAACVTDLGAGTILLFAIDGDQTWDGFKLLFRHWRQVSSIENIRDRLQLVAAMIPDARSDDYISTLIEHGWDLFTNELYDEIPADQASSGSLWNFDKDDDSAPHFPLLVRWDSGLSAMTNLHGRLLEFEGDLIKAVFGDLITGISRMIAADKEVP